MKHWTYSRDGENFGPTDFGGLKQLARSMHLRRDCRVREVGQTESSLAGALHGLEFVEPDPTGNQGSGIEASLDHAYLAQQRRIISATIFGGAAFLVMLVVVTIALAIVL